MIGEKSLKEIKAEIRAALAKEGIDVDSWIEQQKARLQRESRPDPGAAKALQEVCRAIRSAVGPIVSNRGKAKKSSRKKKPAA